MKGKEEATREPPYVASRSGRHSGTLIKAQERRHLAFLLHQDWELQARRRHSFIARRMSFEKKMTRMSTNERLPTSTHCRGQGGISAPAS